MNIQKPKKLNKEPIVDAVFELRFNCVTPAASILPGILYSKLSGDKKIENLPAAQLPEQIRAADPNLQFAPLTRIMCGNFVYLISDRSMAVACKIPYSGWTAFKFAILEAMEHISEAGIITSVQRYGLKYVDMISTDYVKDKVSMVKLSLTIGEHKLENEKFQVKIEVPDQDVVNVIQIVSDAEIKLPNGSTKKGLVIDIDTIGAVNNLNMVQLLEALPNILENIHTANIDMFFNCLTPKTIETLEPIYE